MFLKALSIAKTVQRRWWIKMSTTHWCNRTNGEIQKCSEKNPFQCRCFYHRSHTDCSGTEPGSQESESGRQVSGAAYQLQTMKLYWKIGQMFTFVSKRKWANSYSKCRVANLSFSACLMTIVNIIWAEEVKIMKWHLWETKYRLRACHKNAVYVLVA
jgi:hypothetical protein